MRGSIICFEAAATGGLPKSYTRLNALGAEPLLETRRVP